METREFCFQSIDGTMIRVLNWLPSQGINAHAMIQISHGMAEHIERYTELAQRLTDAGYIVYGNDHRGHGKTAGAPEQIGYLADQAGWHLLVEDMRKLTDIMIEANPGLPVFLFGHSMGSFLVRTYLQDYSEKIKGAIICGTGQSPSLLFSFGIMVAKCEIRSKGKKHRSILLNRLSFGSFNKSFRPNRAPFDWINRDEKEVDQYIADPYCGAIFTAGFFYDFLSGLKVLCRQEKNMQNLSKEPALLFISGGQDPVGNFTKGVKTVISSYQKAGFRDIQYKFYQESRHEIIHELNKEEVMKDIVNWLDRHLKSMKEKAL